jgi:uncharacterized protein YycO
MRIGFAFFKARHGGIFSRGITLRTGGPHSHVEFYLTTDYVVEEGTGVVRHWCFSSYEGDGGVRWKHIDISNGKWTRLEFEVELEKVKEVVAWTNSQVGKAYDWAGILGFVNPWRKGGDPDRWFCSEICAEIALKLGIVNAISKRRDKISPRDLWELLKDLK